MRKHEVEGLFEGKEKTIVEEFLNGTEAKKRTQALYNKISCLKEGNVKIKSIEWLKDRIIKMSDRSLPQLERYVLRYGKELGEKKNKELLKKNSEANSGSNNAMYGVSMEERLIKKHGKKEGLEALKLFKENVSKVVSGENNPMHGKSFYDCWVEKYGREIADEKLIEFKKGQSKNSKGKKNPMYGKPSPKGSGTGIGGWYKFKTYFRSLLELSYLIFLDENNIPWKNAEKIISIKYKDKNGDDRTYRPDFIINENEVIEIKPKELYRYNIDKFKAGYEWCKKNNYTFKIITPDFVSKEKIQKLINDGSILFNKSKRIEKYLKSKRH